MDPWESQVIRLEPPKGPGRGWRPQAALQWARPGPSSGGSTLSRLCSSPGARHCGPQATPPAPLPSRITADAEPASLCLWQQPLTKSNDWRVGICLKTVTSVLIHSLAGLLTIDQKWNHSLSFQIVNLFLLLHSSVANSNLELQLYSALSSETVVLILSLGTCFCSTFHSTILCARCKIGVN